MIRTKRTTTRISCYRKLSNQFFAKTIQSKKIACSARKLGFVKRSTSRINGSEFLKALIEASLNSKPIPLSGIVDILESIEPKASMTIQALRQRLNSSSAEAFLKGQLRDVMSSGNTLFNTSNRQKGNSILSSFHEVLIEDTTEWTLHNSLQEHYRGTGGTVENTSAMRLHVIWDYNSKKLLELTDTDRRTSDQTLANNIIKHIHPGSLVIRDLGFYNQTSLVAIQEAGAFFLSRLHVRTNVFSSLKDEKPLNLANYLDQNVKMGKPLDSKVWIFQGKFQVRLVAFKAKAGDARRRIKKYLKVCKWARRTPNEQTLRLMHYTVYVTNVSKAVWSAQATQVAYKVRWQIELLFKCWKSQINIHVFQGTNIHRIRCLLYAKLIGLIMLQSSHSLLQRYAEDNLDKEVSLPKLVNWLQREGRISQIIRYGYSEKLWKLLINQLGRILSKEDNRKRQTTLQRIDNMGIKAEMHETVPFKVF